MEGTHADLAGDRPDPYDSASGRSAMTMPKQSVRRALRVDIRLADEIYMAWSTAKLECHQALEAWFAAGRGERADANCAYRAALDREEAAARVLEWHARLLSAL
jgi:hypothetical protein